MRFKSILITIVGGSLKGSKLHTPKGNDVRPTLGRTRDAIFNVLTSRYKLSQYRAVDLFAGSGALGLEAVSRGTKKVVFTEKDKQHYQIIKKNIEKLHVEALSQVFLTNAVRWIDSFAWSMDKNLILIDPPYRSDLAQIALDKLGQMVDLLHKSLIVLESHESKITTVHNSFQLFQRKKYGNTTIAFYEVL